MSGAVIYEFSARFWTGAGSAWSSGDRLLLIVKQAANAVFAQYAGRSLCQLRERGFEVLAFLRTFATGPARQRIGAFCERIMGIDFPLFAKSM